MLSQLTYFIMDYKRAIGKHRTRAFYLWLSWGIIGLLAYRTERSLYLFFGGGYPYIRLLFSPLLNLIKALSNLDIHYKADIGPGLLILHHSMGVVISGRTKIGKNLTLVGGNVIGTNQSNEKKNFIIGNNVSLGANAVIIGPVNLGDNIKIGASACVMKDAPSDCTLVGIPAKIVKRHKLINDNSTCSIRL